MLTFLWHFLFLITSVKSWNTHGFARKTLFLGCFANGVDELKHLSLKKDRNGYLWQSLMLYHFWKGAEKERALRALRCACCSSLPVKGLHQQQLWGALHAIVVVHWERQICICGCILWTAMLIPISLPLIALSLAHSPPHTHGRSSLWEPEEPWEQPKSSTRA